MCRWYMLAARNRVRPLPCPRGVQGEWDRQALNNRTDLSIPLITRWTRGSAGVPDAFCLPLHIHTLLSPSLSVLKADSCSLRQMVLLFSASGWDWAHVGLWLETRGREGSAAGVFMPPGPWGLTEGPDCPSALRLWDGFLPARPRVWLSPALSSCRALRVPPFTLTSSL